MSWLQQNLANILTCLALGGVVFLSVFVTVQSRRKGKPSCGGSCACCKMCKCCQARQKEAIK